MINVYNILNDEKNRPKLNIQREIDIDIEEVSIEESVEILNEFFDMNCLNVEHAYLIGYDNKMNIVGIFLVSVGTITNCSFYQRSIITFLLLSGATRFILYHNHPNGILEASGNDYAATYTIKSLATDLDLELIDSVIITRTGWMCVLSGSKYDYDDDYDDEF